MSFISDEQKRFIEHEIMKFASVYSSAELMPYSDKDWIEYSLVNGLPSLAIFFGQLAKFDSSGNWSEVEARYLNRINEIVESQIIESLSLWSGLCSVAFSYICSPNFYLYESAYEHINELIFEQIPIVWDQAMSNLNHDCVEIGDYDVISGLSGVAMYLLNFPNDPRNRSHLSLINKYFVKLINSSKLYNGVNVPKWHIIPELLFHDEDRRLYPEGYLNFSLSHGIWGPFTVLVRCLALGIEVVGQREAIRKIENIMESFISIDEKGAVWPKIISVREYDQGRLDQTPARLDSWCYGEPAYVHGLLILQDLKADSSCDELITKTLTGLMLSSLQIRNEDVGLCHGDAGILYQINLIKSKIELKGLDEYSKALFEHLFEKYKKNDEQLSIDHSLLNGKIGILLVWISMLMSEQADIHWGNALLLSGN